MARPILILCLSALLLAACSDSGGEPGLAFEDAGSADVVQASDTGASAEDAGVDVPPAPEYGDPDPVLAGSLQLLLDEHLAFTGELNASLTVLLPDNVRWRGVSGVKDLLTDEPMVEGAAFRVGSSTKPVIAALSLLLQEEGLISLDDPLGAYVPEYESWADITLRELLSMRSGIADYPIDQTLWLDMVQHPDEYMSPERLLGYVSGIPLRFEPGSECLYSNTNYVLMGLAIEEATGNKVEDEIRERIVEPLGLEHTYLDVDADEDDRLAHGYMDPRPAFSDLGVPAQLVGLIPEELFIADNILDCAYLFHPSLAWTAGALVTTTEDMAKFMRAFVEAELVSEESLAQVMDFPDCVILGSAAHYGLGMSQHETPDGDGFGHGGLIYGYTANTTHVPSVELTYSHMHGAYPAQQWGLVSEIHRIVGDPLDEVPEPCGVPDGFFDPDAEGDRLEARVRGALNEGGAAAPLGAIANVTAWIGGERYPLYGTATVASLIENPASTRAQIFSLGPACRAGYDASWGMLNIDVAALQQQMADGLFETYGSSYALFGIVADVVMNDQGVAERYCIAAVPDVAAVSRMSVCDADSMTWEVGSLARLFAELPLVTTTEAIEAYVRPLGLAQCNCLASVGEWAPCEEGEKKRADAVQALPPLRDILQPRLVVVPLL